VVSPYSPPRHNIKAERYAELFKTNRSRFIIGGDFNAKHTHWGSRLITTKGRELLKAINEYKCEAISTGKATYWPKDPNRIPDLLDFCITKNISSNYIQIEDNLELGSNHSPILLTLSENITQKPCNPLASEQEHRLGKLQKDFGRQDSVDSATTHGRTFGLRVGKNLSLTFSNKHEKAHLKLKQD
jgi:hypothetical protein